MDTGKSSSVLACVTGQYDCDRIIKSAKRIADDTDCDLRVLTILKPTTDYTDISDEIEYLYLVAKESGADMTVIFSDNPPKAAAEFAKENNIQRLVSGMHDGGSESFLVKFNELCPLMPITMVAKDNMIYTMEVCKSYSK